MGISMKMTNGNNGMSIIVRVLLILIIPSIVGELTLARYAWLHEMQLSIMEAQIKDLMQHKETMEIQIIKLEMDKRPSP